MKYNVFIIANQINQFCLALDLEEVEQVVVAYEAGDEQLMLPGRKKISFINFDKLTIYEAGEHSEDDVKAILDRTATSGYGPFPIWKETQLRQIGNNVTKEFIKLGSGQGCATPIDLSSIFDQLSPDFFHEEVVNVSGNLFATGHFKQAAQEAAVGVIYRVREMYRAKTGNDRDGKPLMMSSFNEDDPVIELFKDTVEDSKGLQEGYKFIFAGLVLAIRNPKAHTNFDIEKVDAIELLFLCSRLHKKLDNAVE